MAGESTQQALREIRALYALGPVGGTTDAQLVARFLDRGDDAEAAFAALVERHGPMVLGVCRRMLGADAEDAFQAVFLVLARRAGAIRRRDGLKAWLHGVAVRTAKEARRRSARRRAREGAAMDRARSRSVPDEHRGDHLALLDEELSRLPERYRLPLVLCELEGASRQDAARRLNLPEGTLSSRLARGRALLRDRLARRGVALGAGALAGLIPEPSVAAVPVGLADATVRLALAYTAGGIAAGAVPASVASLADGVLTMISLARWKLALIAAAALVAGLSAAWAASPGDGDKPEPIEPAKVAAKGAGDAAKPGDPQGQVVRGTVVDEAGRPVAGAEVRFYPFTFLESVGVTGPDGTFALPTRPEAGDRVILLARDADGARLGYVLRGVSPSLAAAGAPVRVVLKPGRDVVVRVTGPDGLPVAGAPIEIPNVAAGMTGADGRATLRLPIDVRIPWVCAFMPGLGFDCAEFGPITGGLDRGTPAAELPATIDLALDGARTVRIRAVDAAGRPVAGVAFRPQSIQFAKRHTTVPVGGGRMALATTGADGVATFDWLPDGKNPVSFMLASDEFSTPRLALRDDGDATTLTARLYRKGTIRGRVTTPDGAPAVGIRVWASGEGRGAGGIGRARTAADGSYAITVSSDAAYLVGIEDEDWAAPNRGEIVLREGGPPAGVDFRLERGTLIRGRVTVGADNRPAAGRQVALSVRSSPVPADLSVGDGRGTAYMSSRTTLTGPDGSFAFRVGRGTYAIGVQGRERMPFETFEITDQAEVVRDFHMDRPARGPISGRVVLASDPGRGVAGAKVETIASPSGEGLLMGLAATTGADGRFRGERRLAPAVLRAASPDGTLAGVADVDADTAEVVIAIGPTASATGRALDDRGLPMGIVPIDCDIERSPAHATRIGHETTTDALGQFTATGLVVGQRYRVAVPTGPNRSAYLTSVVAREPGPIDMGTLQLGSALFRDDNPRPGAVAPPIRGTTLDGKPIAADDFRGKFVLLTFWGTWCGPCLDELPKLQAVHDAFGADPRFAMVSLSVDGAIDAPRRFVAERKLPGVQGYVGPRFPGSPSEEFGVRVVPATILLGPDGKVISKGMRGDAIKAAVAEALGKAP